MPNRHPARQAEASSSLRLLGNVAAWLQLAGGTLGLLIAEIVLTWPMYFAFADFAAHWLLAFALLVIMLVLGGLTCLVTVRAIRAFRSQLSTTRFLGLSAMCLGVGVIDFVAAVAIYILALFMFAGGFHTIPTIHVH